MAKKPKKKDKAKKPVPKKEEKKVAMLPIKCGNCKQYHSTILDVKACYEKAGRFKVAKEQKAPAPEPRKREALPFPPGRYAIKRNGELRFYKIDQPEDGKWAGYVFVSVQASSDFHPIKNAEEKQSILDKIAKNPRKAMLTYGREIGTCGYCGRTLTNKESREYGIGPVCRVTARF